MYYKQFLSIFYDDFSSVKRKIYCNFYKIHREAKKIQKIMNVNYRNAISIAINEYTGDEIKYVVEEAEKRRLDVNSVLSLFGVLNRNKEKLSYGLDILQKYNVDKSIFLKFYYVNRNLKNVDYILKFLNDEKLNLSVDELHKIYSKFVGLRETRKNLMKYLMMRENLKLSLNNFLLFVSYLNVDDVDFLLSFLKKKGYEVEDVVEILYLGVKKEIFLNYILSNIKENKKFEVDKFFDLYKKTRNFYALEDLFYIREKLEFEIEEILEMYKKVFKEIGNLKGISIIKDILFLKNKYEFDIDKILDIYNKVFDNVYNYSNVYKIEKMLEINRNFRINLDKFLDIYKKMYEKFNNLENIKEVVDVLRLKEKFNNFDLDYIIDLYKINFWYTFSEVLLSSFNKKNIFLSIEDCKKMSKLLKDYYILNYYFSDSFVETILEIIKDLGRDIDYIINVINSLSERCKDRYKIYSSLLKFKFLLEIEKKYNVDIEIKDIVLFIDSNFNKEIKEVEKDINNFYDLFKSFNIKEEDFFKLYLNRKDKYFFIYNKLKVEDEDRFFLRILELKEKYNKTIEEMRGIFKNFNWVDEKWVNVIEKILFLEKKYNKNIENIFDFLYFTYDIDKVEILYKLEEETKKDLNFLKDILFFVWEEEDIKEFLKYIVSNNIIVCAYNYFINKILDKNYIIKDIKDVKKYIKEEIKEDMNEEEIENLIKNAGLFFKIYKNSIDIKNNVLNSKLNIDKRYKDNLLFLKFLEIREVKNSIFIERTDKSFKSLKGFPVLVDGSVFIEHTYIESFDMEDNTIIKKDFNLFDNMNLKSLENGPIFVGEYFDCKLCRLKEIGLRKGMIINGYINVYNIGFTKEEVKEYIEKNNIKVESFF